MKPKIVALIVLACALVGLVWWIEASARPVTQRASPAASQGQPAETPGHEGHGH